MTQSITVVCSAFPNDTMRIFQQQSMTQGLSSLYNALTTTQLPHLYSDTA